MALGEDLNGLDPGVAAVFEFEFKNLKLVHFFVCFDEFEVEGGVVGEDVGGGEEVVGGVGDVADGAGDTDVEGCEHSIR